MSKYPDIMPIGGAPSSPVEKGLYISLSQEELIEMLNKTQKRLKGAKSRYRYTL